MELFTDGLPELLTPLGIGVAVLLQVLVASMGERLVEKFKNLQPYIMGGQAERMWTSLAPLA